MPSQDSTPPSSTESVKAQLQNVAKVLHDVDHLNPQAQELLAELVEELSRSLDTQTVPTQELAHLTDCAAQLVHVARQSDETGAVSAARKRLDKAIVRIDARFPTIAAIGRRLVDTLADLGI